MKKGRQLDIIITIVGLGMVVYQFAGIQLLPVTTLAFTDLHYAFALTLVYLMLVKKRPRLWPVWTLLLVLSIASTTYVYIFEDDLLNRSGHPLGADLFIGTSLVVVGMVAAWFAFSPVIPIVALAFIAYGFSAQYLPYPLTGISPTFTRLVTMLYIGLQGMSLDLLRTSANTIFYFMVFAGVFNALRATAFFEEVGKFVGRISRAGPAQSAVITSALFGTVSGAGAANVATTGSFTIPAMKKIGFKPEVAASFEATASTGGQIMPPVMGVTAFVLAQFVNIPYAEVMVRAVIPAVLFFLCVGVQAELIARRDRVASESGLRADRAKMVLLSPLFVVPLGLLVVLLVEGHSVGYTTAYALLSLVGLCLLRKETRASMRNLVGGFVDGASRASELAVTVAAITPVVMLTTSTGLGFKLPSVIEILSMNTTLIPLVLIAITAIILGMGMPTIAVYIIVALVAAPVVVHMGIPLLPAHMFVFYFGVIAAVTPPLALSAMVAARIANANYFKTGLAAFKLSIVGFIVPFLFVYNPAILGYFEHPVSGVVALILTVVLIFLLSVALTGYFITRLNPVKRTTAFIGALSLAIYVCTGNVLGLIIGLILGALLLSLQLVRRRGLLIESQTAHQTQ